MTADMTSRSGGEAYAEEARTITPRNVRFDWTDVPLQYIYEDSYATQFWNVMHLVLPEGERAMADVLAQAATLIDEPRLHEEVVGFVGQEAMHASSHEGFRDHLVARGVDVEPVLDRIGFIVDKVFGDHGLTEGRAGRFWFRERLAIYAAAEHYTAVVGEWLLDNPQLTADSVDPTMLDLLRWHGAEELEHRNVAFDAFEYVDGSHARRVRTAFLAFGGLALLWFSTARRMYHDEAIRNASWGRRRWWPLAYWRAARRNLAPGLWFLAKQIPPYLRRGFHPSQMGDTDKAVRYLAVSPAARRAEAEAAA